MKFSVQSNELIGAINKVIPVTPTRSTLPILGNLYFHLEGKELTIVGSDLEVYIKVTLNVDGKANGEVAIPAKRLETLLQNLSNRDLSFELQSNYKLIIKTKGGKWTITGEDPNDFPAMAELENASSVEITSDILTRYLGKAIHAASTDELRRSMNGIYFEIKKGEFRVVSTDGHRLVKIIRKNFDFEGDKLHMLVPIKTCQLITRLFKGSAKPGAKDGEEAESTDSGGSPVIIHFSSEFLTSSFGNITISSRLIDDTFPNYESVIPTDNERKLKVNRDDLISSVKRSIIMSDQITNRTSLQINENQLKVFSANNEYGTDSEETIDCTFSDDEELEIAFNGKYLLEAVQQFENDEIMFDFSTPLKAAIIRPSSQLEDEELMMLVMPVRNI